MAFNTIFTGKNLIELPSVGSTNDFAMEIARHGVPDGTLVLTHEQTAGRGQAGSSWISEKNKNLTFSLILRPGFLLSSEVFDLNKITSLALLETVRHHLPGHKSKIKWPNDILLDAKKIAGILIQTQHQGSGLKQAIIGVGLNVNQDTFDGNYNIPPVSMKLLAGTEFDRMQVLEYFLIAFESWYLKRKSGNRRSLDHAYLQAMLGYQEMMEFRAEGDTFEAQIVGVSREGKLAMQLDEQLKYYDMKEIELLL